MIRKPKNFIAALVGILLFQVSIAAPKPEVISIDPPQNILFVGNSFTYYNNSLHNHVKAMMEGGNKPIGIMRSMTISGARLVQHGPAMPANLRSDDWDIVVLQGHSAEPIDTDRVKGFRSAAKQYSEAILAAGAQPVLFMTWARTHLPEQTAVLDEEYTNVGNEAGAFVVPVGLAFERATQRSEGIALRTSDRRHPTLAGTYLAACTFYAALFAESPVGNSYTAGLSEDVAKSLQQNAWDTVQHYYSVAE